jgi:signal transduction histidine kinase
MFFNPQLVAADPPPDLGRQLWVVEAAARDDSSFVAALDAGNRMLVLQLIATVALALGVLLTVLAYRAKLRLVDLQADFVSSVTHEFKTPIATIQAASESLAAGRIDARARHEYAGYIIQEARRLARLVDNLLTFSRVTTTTVIQQPFEPLALSELVPETLQRFAMHIDEAKFDVSVDVPVDLPKIHGDASAIELMLDNLIDNVIRHSRTHRRLQIRTVSRQGRVILEVSDLGGGIPDDELEQVTRKFYRGRNAGHGGTGLGLAIAKRIVNDHGGSLAVHSEEGIGTTVTVSFPALASNVGAQASSLAYPAN